MAHLQTHTHDLSYLNEFKTTKQRLPTDFEAAHLSEVCDSDFSEYRQVCLSILGKEWLHGYYNGN